MPRIMRALRIETHRHVRARGLRRRAHALVVERKPVDLRQQAQRSRGIRRATAEAGRDRQLLVEHEMAEAQPIDPRGQRTRGLEHQIVVAGARRGGGRPGNRELKPLARPKRQPVADAGKRHETFDLVIAVSTTAEHVQRQIDLGGSELGKFA